jgi:hypothetical protein
VEEIMKIKIIFLIAVLLLTSCSPGSEAECAKGVCIDVGFKGRIQEWGPATVVITVQSDHDVSEMGVSLFTLPGIKILRSLSAPEGAKLAFQDDRLYNWQFDALEDVEYTITAEVEIVPPSNTVIEEGDTAKYDIQGATYFPGVDILRKQHSVYLDHLGRETEPGKTITIMPWATDVIEPTPITPTPDPYMSATPTEISYPAPPAAAPEITTTEKAEPTAYP